MPDGGAQVVETKTSPRTADDFIASLKRKEEAGMIRTRAWLAMWQDSLRYFLSDQLHGKKRHKDWDWIVINYIWPSIMQEIAKLSRNYKILAFGTEPSDMEMAEAFQGFLQWQWKKTLHRHGMRIEQLRAILDGKIYGYRVSKIYWDSKIKWDVKQKRWLGEVRHRLWNPAEFWASDKEYVDEGDCGTVRYVELEYAQSQWPDFANKLKEKSVSYPEMIGAGGGPHVYGQMSASLSSGSGDPDKGPETSDSNALLSLVLSTDRNYGSAMAEDGRRYCKISEMYLKDYVEREQSESTPVDVQILMQSGAVIPDNMGGFLKADGAPMTAQEWPVNENKWMEPVYPNGKYIIRNEDIILNPDLDTQVYPHSSWPFIVIPHYLLPHLWQGTDAVTLYRNTQDMINVTVSHLVNNMKQFGDPRVAIEQDAIAVPPGRTKRSLKIFRGAGSIIRLRRGGLNKYRIENPVPPSMAALQLYGLFAQEYKNLVGLQDIAQGKRSTGITATEAQFLAISANDRITLQNVFEEEWVKQVAEIVAEFDQYYYDVGRMVRVVGEEQIPGIIQISQGLKEAHFDIDVEPGQGLPFDEEKRQLRYAQAYTLLQQPINPMLPDMLRILNITGWQKILQKLEPWQQYVQFTQLYEAVKTGQVAPQDAVKMLVQKVTQLYAQEQANTVPTQGQGQGEQKNGNARAQS